MSFYVSTATFFFAPLWRMGPRCSSAETQVCHRSYIIAATENPKKTTDLSQVTDKLYHIMLYTSRWLGFELTTLAVTSIDCTGSCKSNYHMITTMTAPLKLAYVRYVNTRCCLSQKIPLLNKENMLRLN